MNITQVHNATNLWAIKKVMNVAQSQVQQILQTAPVPAVAANLEPHKGSLIDVRV